MLKIEEVGFYESITLDPVSHVVTGKPLEPSAITPDLEEFRVFLRISGTPGSYWLTTDVKSHTEQPGASITLNPTQITLRPGSQCYLSLVIPIKPLPMGMYEMVLRAANEVLGKMGFTIGYPP